MFNSNITFANYWLCSVHECMYVCMYVCLYVGLYVWMYVCMFKKYIKISEKFWNCFKKILEDYKHWLEFYVNTVTLYQIYTTSLTHVLIMCKYTVWNSQHSYTLGFANRWGTIFFFVRFCKANWEIWLLFFFFRISNIGFNILGFGYVQ